jgi:hypothetical protein
MNTNHGVRKTSSQSSTSVGNAGSQNVFKRLRSGNASTSATGTQRYSINSTNNAHRRIEQQLRNVALDKRLNELKQAQTQYQQSTTMLQNKYQNRQEKDHENNRVINSTINKSGANLTANFNRSKHAPQTQRATQDISEVIKSTTGRNAIGNSSQVMNGSHGALPLSQQSMKQSSMNKHSISSVTSKILSENEQR